jgi:hypothetical protein
LALSLCTFFLVYGIIGLKKHFSSTDGSLGALFKLGIGAISPLTLIAWDLPSVGARGLITNVLVANVAQPILSFLYFSYNGLFTSLFVAYEWESFARKKKGLRVSGAQVGAQRSTYFLQLPYRIALPLMGISGLLHWLVSQSIFLVNIESVPTDPDIFKEGFTADQLTCGYSPIAIFAVILVGIFMIGFVLTAGMQRFKSGMPVAGSCSASISAACHAYSEHRDENAALGKLSWGTTVQATRGIGHCSFSSTIVETPTEGKPFAWERIFPQQ